MMDEQGGVIDDLVAYYLGEDYFRLVVNAATREKDLAWISQQAEAFGVEVRERAELAIIAVQGPQARDKVNGLLAEADRARAGALARFAAIEVASASGIPL